MQEFKGTQGEWSVPHFADSSQKCDCRWVLSEQYCGSIATVDWSKDRSIDNGDNPPLDEAIANAHLIAAAPELLKAALDFVEKVDDGRARSTDSYNKFKQAINKALNIK
jgi:hypothetical protein